MLKVTKLKQNYTTFKLSVNKLQDAASVYTCMVFTYEFFCQNFDQSRLDWSWSLTKSTIKLKAKLKNIPFSKFVFVSQTKETSRFLLQQFHWLPLDKLVNFLLAGIPLSPCPSLKLCTCRCLVLIGFQLLQQWRLCCAYFVHIEVPHKTIME